jgi:hypothetical protein
MRALLLLSVAFVLGTTVAQAETFTFTGKNTQGMLVAAPGPGGKPMVGATSKLETSIVWASGAKVQSTGDCIGWTAPPTSGATNQLVCNSTDADGSKSAAFLTCISTNEKNTESDCWGRIVYTSGKLQGKVSTFSLHGKQNADGKGGTSVGAGNMN